MHVRIDPAHLSVKKLHPFVKMFPSSRACAPQGAVSSDEKIGVQHVMELGKSEISGAVILESRFACLQKVVNIFH